MGGDHVRVGPGEGGIPTFPMTPIRGWVAAGRGHRKAGNSFEGISATRVWAKKTVAAPAIFLHLFSLFGFAARVACE